ncbi:MAG TPA: hypothetical protein PLM07_03745 [Candidatus Rifleibacterium sp.]|nr:hypothetical protein [Candidatus Rifleibacterium sp.]HPT44998.1 hypothetical protein [Candidatus Rifleibacterium sp.]
MSGQAKCRFCGKETAVPDNITGTTLRCPYCIRDFEIFSPESPASSELHGNSAICGRSVQADPEFMNAVQVVISNRNKCRRNQNIMFAVAVLIAAPVAWLLRPEEDLLTLALFIILCLLIGGIFLTLVISKFHQKTAGILQQLTNSPAASASSRRQLYRSVLSALSECLQIDESEVVSDPLLRQALQRLEDHHGPEQRC